MLAGGLGDLERSDHAENGVRLLRLGVDQDALVAVGPCLFEGDRGAAGVALLHRGHLADRLVRRVQHLELVGLLARVAHLEPDRVTDRDARQVEVFVGEVDGVEGDGAIRRGLGLAALAGHGEGGRWTGERKAPSG